ncbi:hypothetical protein ES288_D06G112200v1 [Gossypium darwinii]|uniref:Uncharacterized protein n=1 Tax=Gossypium darwinii TaxID=34276 RepID=A0A5D2C5C9_GOSDA|nr:hypothetical protein ES288_D06G112200v1 [Gossypium darwinii]
MKLSFHRWSRNLLVKLVNDKQRGSTTLSHKRNFGKGKEDIEGVVEDSISSSWKSQGLALFQVECYLMLYSMVVYLSRNLN